jgi:hypothetical protein
MIASSRTQSDYKGPLYHINETSVWDEVPVMLLCCHCNWTLHNHTLC